MASPHDSGDDSGDEQQLPPRRETIPDAVDHFLGMLLDGLQTRNISQIHTLYEDTFNKLTDKYYKQTRWPHVDSVKDQISENPLFLILYQELFYRHVFTRLPPTFDDRIRSWENYCKLLDLIVDDLTGGEDLTVGLPPQWVWDLLDEFVYHYQTYCNFRSKAVKKHDSNERRNSKNIQMSSTPLRFWATCTSSSRHHGLKST